MNAAASKVGPPTARKLRLLRWKLTFFFVAASAAGLAVFAALVASRDGRLQLANLDADNRLRATDASRALPYVTAAQVADGTYPRCASLPADVKTATAPASTVFVYTCWVEEDARLGELAVVEVPATGGGQPSVVFRLPDETSSRWPGLDLTRVAAEAARGRVEVTQTGRDSAGRDVRLLALPLPRSAAAPFGAAVVALADPGPGQAVHDGLVRSLWLGSAATLVLLGLVGFWVTGRSTRPALEALAQQERFLADAAHELRTPVASLRAASESALADSADPRPVLADVARVSERAGTLVDDLLTLARMDAGRVELRRQPMRLDLLVEEVLAEHPDARFDARDAVCAGDPKLLRRAIANLVENAERHGRSATGGAPVEVWVRPGAVTVADRGPGIEPGILPHLFERFHSGRSSGGSGLGLAIVAWVARAHGGVVEAENREGGGAVFVLHLPG